jgi:hypothetical protein
MHRGRLSRKKRDWGSEPSRSAERSAAVAVEEQDPSRRPPGKKDRRAYCKPTHGQHTPTLVKRGTFTKACRWRLDFDPRHREWVPEWLCFHEEVCSGCGKVLSVIGEKDCPDWHEPAGSEREKLDAEIARRTAVRNEYEARKPVPAGPQGYRRAKGGAC